MKSYSQDLRLKVLGAYDRGMKTTEIVMAFGISPARARRVRQRRREHGELGLRPRIGARRYKIDRTRLGELVQAQPDATLAELLARLGVECALSAVWNALWDLGLTYKKDHSRRGAGSSGCRAAASRMGPLACRH